MRDPSFHPHNRAEALARELADTLGDPEGLPFYLRVAARYSESYLRTMLRRVMEIPPERIRTSRGALFNWLVQHYGEQPPKTNPSAHPGP